MSERDLEAHLDAIERALTDDGSDLTDLRETAEAVDEASDLEARVADLESRVADLEAGLQAVRGYAGNVRAVNREVERRASAALAKAETLEAAVGEDDAPVGTAVPAREPESNPKERSVANTDVASASPRSADPEGANAGSGPEMAHSATDAAQSATDATQSATDVSASAVGPPARDGAEQRSGQRTGRRRRGRRTAEGSRPGSDEGGSDEPGPGEAESQTEQFIERVRDAL